MVEREVPSIAILASGSGSTAEACIHATKNGKLRANIGIIICNNPPAKAGIYDRVARLNAHYGSQIPVLQINGITHPVGAGQKGIFDHFAIQFDYPEYKLILHKKPWV